MQPPDFYDREYNPRIGVSDPAGIFRQWQRRSAEAREQFGCRLDLAYGSGGNERLDLFPAQGNPQDAPLLVFIHGGFWRAFARSDFHWVAPAFVQRGVSVALIGYELAPKASLSTIVEQARASIAWLQDNAARLGCSSERMVVAGHSAGGHLAAMAGCPPRQPPGDGAPRRPIDALIAISALADLAPLRQAPSIDADVRLSDDEVLHLSPAQLVPMAGVRVVTAVGALESSEFRRQNALLRERWPSNFEADIALPKRNHFGACEALSETGSPLFEAALRLLCND